MADSVSAVPSISSQVRGTETSSLLHNVVPHDCLLGGAPALQKRHEGSIYIAQYRYVPTVGHFLPRSAPVT